MPRRNTPASPPSTAGLGDSWPGRGPGDMTLRVVLAVIISSTSGGMPLSSRWRALFEHQVLEAGDAGLRTSSGVMGRVRGSSLSCLLL